MGKNVKARSEKSRSQLTKADRQAIKQEQAAFIDKINTAVANEHQQAIFAVARSGVGVYAVIAGPGSGKTFTGIKASTLFAGSSIYFSYNKKIQVDTNHKLIAIDSPMVATTAHAFGLSCLMTYSRGQCKVDDKDEKYSNIVRQYISGCWSLFIESIKEEIEEDEEADPGVMRLDATTWTNVLVHYAQVSLTSPTPANLVSLVDDFDLLDINRGSLVWPFVVDAVAVAIKEGIRQFLTGEHLCSYDDMIYLPNVLPDVSARQYDHVVVDEAQDTSRASLELMLKACHRSTQIFFIGDPLQGIYAFAGADFDSINRIIARLDAKKLPLRICYRCGRKIVDIANQLCAEDEQLISAGLHEGNVEVVGTSDYLEKLQPGDAVVGRTTRMLVQGCLRVLQTGKLAKVLGKNIGDNIAAVVTRLEAKRVQRGVPALLPDLSNFLELLKEYKEIESRSLQESRQDPEMALSELSDKIDTVEAFFEAYISKCHDERLRVPEDPRCEFSKTSKDFKMYIRDLFSDEENVRDFILFMTAHRSKGGEWKNVYIIGTEEFPHPKAKSNRQKQQERNLMYVAVTRAMENLYFVGAPFKCLEVPGYDPAAGGLTIISYPAAGHLEIHSSRLNSETVEPFDSDEEERVSLFSGVHDFGASDVVVNSVGPYEDYDPMVVDTLFNDALGIPRSNTFYPNEIEVGSVSPVVEPEVVEALEPGKFSRVLAIEVLCPACNNACVDPATGSLSITYDLVGHTVICSVCKKACIVPLNAFSLHGDVVAREKPATGITNNKKEKKGRTQKERKSKAGRKPKGNGVRQPMQLSLDIKVINTLNLMGVNKSELYEDLLQQYEPFLEAWAELDNEDAEGDEDELDHDEMEEDEE